MKERMDIHCNLPVIIPLRSKCFNQGRVHNFRYLLWDVILPCTHDTKMREKVSSSPPNSLHTFLILPFMACSPCVQRVFEAILFSHPHQPLSKSCRYYLKYVPRNVPTPPHLYVFWIITVTSPILFSWLPFPTLVSSQCRNPQNHGIKENIISFTQIVTSH